VVVQPLPPAAAAAIAQMALTQHPKESKPPLQPFELGPEATGDISSALPVSQLPTDAILTTELGAQFDSVPEMLTTELAGGFGSRAAGATTSEMAPRNALPSVSTSEMAPDFGRVPSVDEPQVLAPEFDVHASTGRGVVQGREPSYAATTEMGAFFGRPTPSMPSAEEGLGARPAPSRSLMPATRPVADQSTQELAEHFLSAPDDLKAHHTVELAGGFGRPSSDPMDQLGRDMFPPIIPPDRPARARFTDDESYEATQALDAGQFSTPFPVLEDDPGPSGGFGSGSGAPANRGAPLPALNQDEAEPYETTQALEHDVFAAPLPSLDDGGDDAKGTDAPSSPGHELTVDFGNGAVDEFDRTMEVAGGFRGVSRQPEPGTASPFPPLKF
jgi:hypothetical protein